MASPSWHTLTSDEVLSQLGVDAQTGLSDSMIEQRRTEYGFNELSEAPPRTFLQRLLDQFNNFVIYILLFAAGISFVISIAESEAPYESIAILAIVLLNTILGVVQEGRAEQALAALKKLAAPEARVLRNGRTVTVPAREVLPGDVVLLEAGDSIPADLRLIEAVNLRIEEASLTGESVPVQKDTKVTQDPNAVLGDRHSIAYMSTVSVYGRGKGVVISTGMNTEIGKIADQLQQSEDEETPLQKQLNDLGRTLSIAALIICGLIFAISVAQALSNDEEVLTAIEESFLVAISLAIAAVPEGLPAVVTINLALGMREMIKRNALIRRLPAVETLGSADAICSDKTGTLTQNEMTVVRLVTPTEQIDVSGQGYQPNGEFSEDGSPYTPSRDIRRLLLGGLLASDARLEEDTDSSGGYRMIGDPTEGALVVVAAKADLWRTQAEQDYPRQAEVPFDSDRKRMSTLHPFNEAGKTGYIAFVKGAPDIVIDLCTHIREGDQTLEMSEERRKMMRDHNTAMANDALRVLAIAERYLPELPADVNPDTVEHNLEFVGLIAMRDPARPEVKDAIAKARHAGIRTVMVTGDYPATARAIADEIGLLREGGRVISGTELESIDDTELDKLLPTTDVFARVSPNHKVRIVDAFRRGDHVVAMTGDGVNDAPALKRASIGVAMGITGTDVSKESADMILTDDNFASIVAAVEQGRVIYDNIRKFVYFLLSCNLAEISTIFIATLLGWGSPLTPIQLLWLNLVTDGAPALALGVEKGDPNVMEQQPRRPNEPIINRPMQVGMIIQTIIMTAVTLIAFSIGREESFELGSTMAFLTLSGAQLARAYSSRSELYSVFSLGLFSNQYMQYAVVTSALGLLLTIYIPFLSDIFETTAPTLEQWGIILVLLMIPTIVAEASKPFIRQVATQQPQTRNT